MNVLSMYLPCIQKRGQRNGVSMRQKAGTAIQCPEHHRLLRAYDLFLAPAEPLQVPVWG